MYLVLRLGMRGGIPLLPLYAFSVWTVKTLHLYGLFNEAVDSSGYVVPNIGWLMSCTYIVNYVERSSRGLFQGTVAAFSWSDCVKVRETAIRVHIRTFTG